MTSLAEKNSRKFLSENRESIANQLFELLKDGKNEDKKAVRDFAKSEEMDGEIVLMLAQKIFDSDLGWGRAKRTAITSWYLNRPLEEIKRDIEATPKINNVSHKDLCKMLCVSATTTDPNRKIFFEKLESSGQAPFREIKQKRKLKKVSFLNLLLNLFK